MVDISQWFRWKGIGGGKGKKEVNAKQTTYSYKNAKIQNRPAWKKIKSLSTILTDTDAKKRSPMKNQQ